MNPKFEAAHCRTLRSAGVLVCLSSLILLAPLAGAQTVTEQVPVGLSPQAVAVNPVTNKTYIANSGSNTVTIIDGETGITTSVSVGASPSAIAINTVTNKVYVADKKGTDVSVIDGATNAVTEVVVGSDPDALAVNPVTDKIYVANSESNTVTVIDGATDATTTIAVGTSPAGVAVNLVTDKIYVSNSKSNNVSVIDGSTSAVCTTVAVGTKPVSVAVDPVTDFVYVANTGGTNVTVINGATNATSKVAVGKSPGAVAIDTVSNTIYVSNTAGSSVTVINGATNATTTIATTANPGAITVDEITNQVYVGEQTNVLAIDGASNTITNSLAVGGTVTALVVNPVTDKVYAPNLGTGSSTASNDVAVIDGSTNTESTVASGDALSDAINPVTNTIYVVNDTGSGNDVLAIDGATGAVTTLSSANVGGTDQLAVDTVTNKIYYVDATTGGLGEIDGATNTVTVYPIKKGLSGALSVNSVTNKIYAANPGSSTVLATITVINGTTHAAKTLTVGHGLALTAIDPVTNKVYVTNSYDGTVSVIDGATNAMTTLNVGGTPGQIAVNPVTDKIYVGGTGATMISVIDGATNAVKTVDVGSEAAFGGIAINTITNKIYVGHSSGQNTCYYADDDGTIVIIDGNTNATATIALPANYECGDPIAVNLSTNTIYVAEQLDLLNGTGAITSIDGATNTVTATTSTGGFPITYDAYPFVAVDPINNAAYLPYYDFGAFAIDVLTPAVAVHNPLNTTVTPLTNNVTTSPSPTFDFTATSTYAPIAPAVRNVYYQLDTTQGPWTKATGTAPDFTGKLSKVALGNHTLYFYATDDTDATDFEVGAHSVGAISAYAFTVVTQ